MRVPRATYRLQFRPEFGFSEASRVLDYLVRLGISDIYASPIFRARPGSIHGYDIVDGNALNAELGTEDEFRALVDGAAARGLGWIQDIVPNHRAYDPENALLMDVLENGPHSEYAPHFDIDWEHPCESIRGRLLAPFLGDLFGAVLDRGEISLHYGAGGFRLGYFDISFPLSIKAYSTLLTFRLDRLRRQLGEKSPHLVEFLGILDTLGELDDLPGGELRRKRISSLKGVLWRLHSTSAEIRAHIEGVVRFWGEAESAGLREETLSRQWYRFSFWKVANEEINYRRFFNINGLISLRMESEEVFGTTHELLRKFLQAGKITGLRVDHIDGLAGPGQYLQRLRREAGDGYVVVEKILGRGEELSPSWPVQGTTGYEFLNVLNALFCEAKNGRSFNRIYYSFTGVKTSFENMVYEKKKLILAKHMSGDIDNLTLLLERVSSRDRYGIDLTRQGLRRALVEIMADFPVYRTYIAAAVVSENDRSAVQAAVAGARERNPGLMHEIDFIERFLLPEEGAGVDPDGGATADLFVRRFQQFTGPLMAKGFEDTVLYVYNRLLSLNEVGGSPEFFGCSPGEFHRFVRRRFQRTPHSMNATGTHDAKRGEDARARINVLSEMPKLWEEALRRWHRSNRHLKKFSRGGEMPDRNDEYMFYQAMAGSFPCDEAALPLFRERLRAYAVKAVREAKVHTAWLKPDTEYEAAFLSFIDALLSPGEDNRFLRGFREFQRKVSHYGVYNSLAQTIVKITAPGVPDFYQGSELWDFSFVDPDSRRLVDFELRERLMEEICAREGDLPGLARELRDSHHDGRAKLFLIRRALTARKERAETFQRGEYVPLRAAGPRSRHLLCFARRFKGSWAVTVAPRLLMTLEESAGGGREGGGWGGTVIKMPKGAPGTWKSAITGLPLKGRGSLAVGEALADFPVALLLHSTEE